VIECHGTRRVSRFGFVRHDHLSECAYDQTKANAGAMRSLNVRIESLFANLQDWHELRRCRLRGLEDVNGAVVLIAIGQNFTPA
jgi:hypothetical protein